MVIQALAYKVVNIKAPLILTALEGCFSYGGEIQVVPILNQNSSVSLSLPPPVKTTGDHFQGCEVLLGISY